MESRQFEFKVNLHVLQSSKISQPEFGADVQYISDVLKDKLFVVVPKVFNDIGSIFITHHLALSLKFFEGNPTLSRLLDRLRNEIEVESHKLTLWFAHHILGDSQRTEFEPSVGDLSFVMDDQRILFECKRPRISEKVLAIQQEHMKLIENIRNIIDERFQYDIIYLMPEDVTSIPDLLKKTIPYVKAVGQTNLSPTVFLTVTPKDQVQKPPPIFVWFAGDTHDMDSGERLPITCWMGNNKTCSISGPRIDEKEKLENTINRARHQLDKNSPSVLVLELRDVMLNYNIARATVQDFFKKEKNTRLSAVVIVSHGYLSRNSSEVDLVLIKNPFSAHPIPKELDSILKYRKRERVFVE